MSEEFWWKWEYAMFMQSVSGIGWTYSWMSAGVSYTDDPDEDPEYCASEEMSCWSE